MTPESDEQIRELAHLLWAEAGQPEGRDWEFWIAAERQLLEQAAREGEENRNIEADADPMFVATALAAGQ